MSAPMPANLTAAEIERIEGLLAKATPAPWFAARESRSKYAPLQLWSSGNGRSELKVACMYGDDGREANALVELVNAAPSLLAAARRCAEPIPSAERIAALEEVAAAVIDLRREREKWAEMPVMTKPEIAQWERQQSVVGRCKRRMQEAFSRLEECK